MIGGKEKAKFNEALVIILNNLNEKMHNLFHN